MFAFPSAVTAAKTVDEYGAQATSPTALPRSNVNIGSLATIINISIIINNYYYYNYYYDNSYYNYNYKLHSTGYSALPSPPRPRPNSGLGPTLDQSLVLT